MKEIYLFFALQNYPYVRIEKMLLKICGYFFKCFDKKYDVLVLDFEHKVRINHVQIC